MPSNQRAALSTFLGLAVLTLVSILLPSATVAQTTPAPLVVGQGWVVRPTTLGFAELVSKLEEAVKANEMGLVNAASASDGAKAQGFTIPGNRVVGVFRNDYARRMLASSLLAGIEAPIRFYVTENTDGKAVLSYRTPNAVFAPYFAGAKPDLQALAGELDAIFAKITDDATRP